MSGISDDELILFHYRDGLPPERQRLIAAALASTPALALRYRNLQRLLAAADADVPPAPDAQFGDRLWRGLRPRLEAPGTASAGSPLPSATRRARRTKQRWWGAGLATAAALLAALYFPRARIAPPQPVPEPRIAIPAKAPVADRLLAAYVAAHLRNTEALLLNMANSDSPTLMPTGQALRSLVDDNRLYAAAAAKRGDKALAGFLDGLDPVLTELANQPPGAGVQAQGLRDLVRERDLLFQLRAVETRLRSRGDGRPRNEGATT